MASAKVVVLSVDDRRSYHSGKSASVHASTPANTVVVSGAFIWSHEELLQAPLALSGAEKHHCGDTLF